MGNTGSRLSPFAVDNRSVPPLSVEVVVMTHNWFGAMWRFLSLLLKLLFAEGFDSCASECASETRAVRRATTALRPSQEHDRRPDGALRLTSARTARARESATDSGSSTGRRSDRASRSSSCRPLAARNRRTVSGFRALVVTPAAAPGRVLVGAVEVRTSAGIFAGSAELIVESVAAAAP